MKTYKIKIELNVSMDEETYEFYKNSPADLIEALDSKNSKLTIEETLEDAQETWD